MRGKAHTIAPVYNRCVIFNTDADSFHGHPDPLICPENVKRKSLALYYYTASKRLYEDTASYSTMYKARASDDAATKRKVRELVFDNYLKDLTPPIFYRVFNKVKYRLTRGK